MFSNYVKSALDTIQETDDYNWALFNFYPCPVGADTPAGCTNNPGYGKGPDCCIHDKFEACMVNQFNCFENSTTCDTTLRLKMARFLSCYEGSHVEEEVCPADTKGCMIQADLMDRYDEINFCFNTTESVKKAAARMDAACTAEKVTWWPHVRVNNVLLCGDDSCMMPLLPKLCDAYRSHPKPKSCQHLAKEAELSKELRRLEEAKRNKKTKARFISKVRL